MRPDPIIEEIHNIRLAIEAECQGDFAKLSALAAQIEQQYPDQLVDKPFSRLEALYSVHRVPQSTTEYL